MRSRFLVGLAGLSLVSCSQDADERPSPAPEGTEGAAHEETAGSPVSGFGDGVNTRVIAGSVEDAVARLEQALEEQGFTILAKVDHQANAEGLDLALRPATVVVFGKPEVGSSLIAAAPTASLDLPQRMAIYEDADGQTVVAYNDPRFLATRHNITGQDDKLEAIAEALSGLASAAAGVAPDPEESSKED